MIDTDSAELMYETGRVKGPHQYNGNTVYYVTVTDQKIDLYLRKDGSFGEGTIAEWAAEDTRGFWSSKEEAEIALKNYRVKYKLGSLKKKEEPEIKTKKEIKRYTKKEFLKEIKEYI